MLKLGYKFMEDSSKEREKDIAYGKLEQHTTMQRPCNRMQRPEGIKHGTTRIEQGTYHWTTLEIRYRGQTKGAAEATPPPTSLPG